MQRYTRHSLQFLQEYFYTAFVTLLYFIAFIVILAGFSWCARSSWCDARIAAGVRKTAPSKPFWLYVLLYMCAKQFQIIAIFNTIAYALGAYILHNDYKATPPELQWKKEFPRKKRVRKKEKPRKIITKKEKNTQLDGSRIKKWRKKMISWACCESQVRERMTRKAVEWESYVT